MSLSPLPSSLLGHHRTPPRWPVLCSKLSPANYFIHGTVYLSMLLFPLVLLSSSPTVSMVHSLYLNLHSFPENMFINTTIFLDSVYIYIYIYVYMYICIYIYVFIHMHVYICVYIYVCVCSCVNIWYLFIFFWLPSLYITGSRCIHLTRTDSNASFNGWVIFHCVCVCVCVYTTTFLSIHLSMDI